ncbi:MAG: prepilin-type N-terminal cleavage/methylation domain-containing protein [Patescibacteria group bacterium]
MKKGFTLVEMLIVVAVIAILVAIVYVALSPLERFRHARNSIRGSDITAIMEAVKVYQVDHKGDHLTRIAALAPDKFYMIGTATSGCTTGCTAKVTEAACVNLNGLVTAGNLAKIPRDPKSGTSTRSFYYLSKSEDDVITIGACVPEDGATIEIIR